MNIKRSNFSPTKINAMLERHGGKCAYCGQELNNDNFTVDHIIPKSKGGSNHIDNLNGCCLDCNWMKGNLTVSEFRTALSRFVDEDVVFHMDPSKKKKVFLWGFERSFRKETLD